MLKYLLAGGLSAGVSAPLLAQQQPRAPRPTGAQPPDPAGVQRIQSEEPGQKRPETQPVVVNPQELERVLLDWEKKTAHITKLRGEHQQFEYDSVFLVEKRAIGSFWFQSPDKGRIDFNINQQPQLVDPPEKPRKKSPSGEQYRVEAASPKIWSCDGTMVLSVDVSDKTYDKLEIPPHQRGENIIDGPLPFLFGMKADKLKERYQMSLGSQHNPPRTKDVRGTYHIVAMPLKIDDAREWSRAEVLLDATYCVPKAIRLIDPAQTRETVYTFDMSTMKPNEKLPWIPNPFSPPLLGYKPVLTATKELDPRQRSSGILPVGRDN
ncbi:MAG: hypothetical protein KF861_07505 [Planctomycetaceae bacterium]|nr:hypothetical protein [Planctomycetaceae bacterium]